MHVWVVFRHTECWCICCQKLFWKEWTELENDFPGKEGAKGNIIWSNWQLENKGGLGVKDLRKMNISMLCRWWWKLEMGERLWQDVVRKKYVTENGITQLKSRPTNSPIWNDLLKIIEYLLKRQNSIDWRWKIYRILEGPMVRLGAT